MVDRTANTEALSARAELAEITLNSVGDTVISVDASGHIPYLNAAAQAMTGCRADEAAAQRLE